MEKERVKLILQWAMHNRAEDSFQKEFYYWTPEAKTLFNRLTFLGGEYGDRLLIGVIGRSGIGKSALLRALKVKLRESFGEGHRAEIKILAVKWSSEYLKREDSGNCPGHPKSFENKHTIFIDTPDYGQKDVRRINRDLTTVHNVWNSLRECYDLHSQLEEFESYFDANIVVFLQKELLKREQHFFLRKMDIVELRPLKPKELLEAYKTRFHQYDPFIEDSLTLIAELSRGIFRRFMRYIQLCVETMIEKGRTEVTVKDVETVITEGILMQDMALEFYDMFRNERYAKYALKILSLLRDIKKADQKTIAENIGVHPTTTGRIVAILEDNGYVKRERGKRAAWFVKIQRYS